MVSYTRLNEESKIRRLYEEGLSDRDIAENMGWDRKNGRYRILNWRKKNGLKANIKKANLDELKNEIINMYENGNTLNQISQKYNYSELTIRKHFKKWEVKLQRKTNQIIIEKDKLLIQYLALNGPSLTYDLNKKLGLHNYKKTLARLDEIIKQVSFFGTRGNRKYRSGKLFGEYAGKSAWYIKNDPRIIKYIVIAVQISLNTEENKRAFGQHIKSQISDSFYMRIFESLKNEEEFFYTQEEQEKINEILHLDIDDYFKFHTHRGIKDPIIEYLFQLSPEELNIDKYFEEKEQLSESFFDVTNIKDAREKIITSIVNRRGQQKFRLMLLEAYNNKCAITDSSVIELLEAAHIIPYLGDSTNVVSNGIILRADLHILFDLGLIQIDPDSYTVLISDKLKNTEYQNYANLKISLPKDEKCWPLKEALVKRLHL